MERAYAQALWRTIEGSEKPDLALKRLREVLAKHGREALLPKIAVAFKRLAERASANETRLLVADEHHAKSAVKEMVTLLNREDGDVRVCVEPSLIGGWRLEERERVVDASFKNHLLSIYNQVTQ